MWNWLQPDDDNGYSWGFVGRVVLKAAVLFALCNLIYVPFYPATGLGHISGYGVLFPYRERLPYGENPAQSYNLSLDNLPAMFASVTVSRPKPPDEFRVLLVGDSATWGWFLPPTETYAAHINRAGATLPDGRRVVAHNIGYPVLSATKDLLLLDYARRYQPDMVIWLVTAQSLRYQDENGAPVQVAPPVSEWPAARLATLVDRYDLDVTPPTPSPSLAGQTLVGARRDLANLLRLQLYGVAWGATGIDHYIPEEFDLRRTDLEASQAWAGFEGPTELAQTDLAFEVLSAGIRLMDDVPVLVVNEPIFISNGENSDLRYNSFYPRWAYDQYRTLLVARAEAEGWAYADWWDMLPPEAFTDSPVHVTPAAAGEFGTMLLDFMLEEMNGDG